MYVRTTPQKNQDLQGSGRKWKFYHASFDVFHCQILKTSPYNYVF